MQPSIHQKWPLTLQSLANSIQAINGRPHILEDAQALTSTSVSIASLQTAMDHVLDPAPSEAALSKANA